MARDPGLDEHYKAVRKFKSLVGLLFAVIAGIGVWQGADVKVILGLAIMSGVMLDAPSVTDLVSQIIKAIPWANKNGGGSSGTS